MPSVETDGNTYSPSSSLEEYHSVGDSFQSCGSYSTHTDSTRRTSLASSTSLSPTWQYSTGHCIATPVTLMSAKGGGHRVDRCAFKEEETSCHALDGGFSMQEASIWMGHTELDERLFPHPSMTLGPLLSMLELPEQTSYCSDYSTVQSSLHNPSLSRPIFATDESSSGLPVDAASGQALPWMFRNEVPPQTIAPSAAFQPTLSSSPFSKHEPSTPVRHHLRSSILLSSSPMELVSPPVVPSQNHIADTAYASDDPIVSPIALRSRNFDRLHRRGYERKRTVGYSHRPKLVSSRSGLECDLVIAENEHACSHSGCAKRFKRQEHRKRHETTVHEKAKVFKCWVPGCKTAAFTRTDNLKSHQKNTHGTRKATQRNRYVATLDEKSDYYDPNWIGALSEAGFPLQ